MSRSYISVELRKLIAERAQGCCEYCLIPEIAVLFAHQVDHIIAEKHGGLTEADNLALACAICNKYKGSDIASLDANEVVRLFHPRRDNWNAHFALSNAEITPLTADPFALACQDRIENGEYRWQTIGMVEGCLILLVAHTVEENDKTEIIRLISARRADSKERKHYEQSI